MLLANLFFFLKTANLLRVYQALPHDASTTKSKSARGRGGNAADAPTNFIMCNFNTLKAAVVNSTARVHSAYAQCLKTNNSAPSLKIKYPEFWGPYSEPISWAQITEGHLITCELPIHNSPSYAVPHYCRLDYNKNKK